MFISLHDYDLVKSITRTEAKAVHKDLPPGGVWRTIHGHHIYIKDGKVLAGSIPGVTKAKKATKAQITEHQATVDREAKKGTKKSGEKGNAKAKNTKPPKQPKTQRAGASTANKGKTAKKASGSPKPASKKAVSKAPAKKAPAKKAPAKKAPVKKVEPKLVINPKTKTAPADKNDTLLRNLASQSDDGMDLYALAGENPKDMLALREALKTAEGTKTMDKLNYLHKKYGGGERPEYVPANPKGITDFKLGKAQFDPSSIQLTTSSDHRAEASADREGKVIFRSDMLKQPMETQRHVMTHEIGHVISNAYPNLEKHILSNPQDGLGRTNQKAGRFEGVSYTPEESWAESFARYHTEPEFFKKKYPKQYDFVDQVLKKIPNYKDFLDKGLEELDKANGITKKAPEKQTPGFMDDAVVQVIKPSNMNKDSIAEAIQSKNLHNKVSKELRSAMLASSSPADLRSILADKPALKEEIGDIAKRIGSSDLTTTTTNVLRKLIKEQGDVAPEAKQKPKKAPKQPVSSEDNHVELFHGTKLAHLPSIMEHGFDPNGSEDDFGDAVYFKSPAFDHKDHKDWEDWKAEREKAGKQIPSSYKDADRKGNDSKRIVGEFTNKNNPLVIKAVIDKKHVLDCSEGRPKELDDLLKEFDANAGNKKRVRLAFKHVLGEDTSNMSDDAVMEEYSKRKPDLDKKWGSRFMAGKMSPYEVYAKKHGIGAIVDKLDAYKDEGYQIGVYDNKLIKIVDQGKGLNYNDKGVAELVKALRKAMANGYTLLHHSMTDKGLELHIGAYDDTVKKAFIYIDLSKGVQR